MIFEKAMPHVNFVSSPSPYCDFEGDNWWKDKEDSAKVLLEVLKYINYYLFDQFKL